ncbi:hypothetical protein ACFO4O_08290 [Glaciecola siphonariae]|uniref:Transglutaminase-like domain-containing protein n=1 Tax=Glaciecola siphonariae TaxID=521012 RepID=A0ABV9LWX4_9ALTE
MTQSLRPPVFFSDELRFGEGDISLSLEEYRQAVERKPQEDDLAYAKRLAAVIAKGTAHIHWERYEPAKFNQLVPIWENWILHVVGRFSGIPEFERYHFVTPEKSMERGIGICGEVSMLMTTLLENNGIEASMVTVPGHVLVTADFADKTYIFDPDFGVVLPYAAHELADNADSASQLYVEAGYKDYDKAFFQRAFTQPFKLWRGPEHFISNKYYFEKISYGLIWIVPIFLIIVALLIKPTRTKQRRDGANGT